MKSLLYTLFVVPSSAEFITDAARLLQANEAWSGVYPDSDHDIIRGAQCWMECLQVDVQSDGEDFPSKQDMVSFPGMQHFICTLGDLITSKREGAYDSDDPGLLIDIWSPGPLKDDYIVRPRERRKC